MASASDPPKVQKTAFTFKSDVRKSLLESHPSGVLHAIRSSPQTSREEHAFAWVDDYGVAGAACSHLERFGFARDRVQFVPFSSKAEWVNRYPNAVPYVDCDASGNVTGFPYWSPRARSVLDIPPEVAHVAYVRQPSEGCGSATTAGKAMTPVKTGGKKKGGNANRLADTLLTNNERRQLHNEIYNYFSWLTDRVVELETSEAGRRAVKKAGLKVAGLRGLLIKLDSTFGFVQRKGPPRIDGTVMKGVTAPPVLEESLIDKLGDLASAEEEVKKERLSSLLKKKASWEPLDFDLMFGKLLAYKEEHGHPNVPVKYLRDAQLGSWVSGLRTKKKAFDKDGDMSMEVDEEEGLFLENAHEEGGVKSEGVIKEEADASSADVPTPNNVYSQKYLNPERIQRLESIGFSWSLTKPKSKPKTWDERLEELKQWRDDHGTFKVPRAESLGEWLHNQRTLYTKRDTKFMMHKAPRMEEIGYEFNVRESTAVSWDDRFQQLVEYHRKHGSFDVSYPGSDQDEDEHKFYKWVNRLHNEYRAYEKGTPSKLNSERVEKLKAIHFQFKGPKSRGRPSTSTAAPIPNVSWEKRLQQLESYKADIGHLDIDHNYRHCSNLGGWAADISTLYKNWKTGSQQLSSDMIEKFDQLEALGFGFDILPYYENNRSWDDHYEVLLRFKEQHGGSARVPLKFKADLRLGKWVQSQRQQYKLLKEGKESKLTKDRMEKLELAGFEWDASGGGSINDDEDDQE